MVLMHRPLGQTGISVSPLGLGTVKIGRDQQVKYPNGFTIPGDEQVRDLLAVADELGINLLDTAPAYGTSEQRLGELLPGQPGWHVITKVGEVFENGQSRFDFSAAFTRHSVERSLRRLRRDAVDIVLVHSSGDDMAIIGQTDVCETLERLKHEGLLRAWGMSTKTVEGGVWCVEHADVVMATCNLAECDNEVLQRAAELDKGVLVKKGLQSGHADAGVGGGGIRASMEYVLHQAGVDSMVVGTINPEHLRSNASVVLDILSGETPA
jgi:aryl-alcohol dehydrogenase-like predicted oxidoreductase